MSKSRFCLAGCATSGGSDDGLSEAEFNMSKPGFADVDITGSVPIELVVVLVDPFLQKLLRSHRLESRQCHEPGPLGFDRVHQSRQIDATSCRLKPIDSLIQKSVRVHIGSF